MIKTAIQLKAKIRNISGSDSKVAMTMIRVFFMERFLERVSISAYKNQFVLKGGMLVSSLIGLNSRATMDIDATVQALPLTQEEIEKIVNEIGGIPLEDNVSFEIKSIEAIMDEFDYPGVRVHMEGKLDNLKQPIKIDISTDDVITPRAVEYGYQLMFEDRDIELQSYNIETLLAEKLQFGSTFSTGFIDVCFEFAFCGVHLTKTCKNFISAFIEVLGDVVLDVLYHGLSFGRFGVRILKFAAFLK